ncbi:MAG: hypothetical protein AABX55_00030, partial [Nanoarchaeota archaeon]
GLSLALGGGEVKLIELVGIDESEYLHSEILDVITWLREHDILYLNIRNGKYSLADEHLDMKNIKFYIPKNFPYQIFMN